MQWQNGRGVGIVSEAVDSNDEKACVGVGAASDREVREDAITLAWGW